MTDEHERPEEQDDNKPDPGPTKRLEKAIEDISSDDLGDGTLVSIEAHTGEHPVPPEEPSVTDSLKKAKQGGAPDIQPAATMYEPTRPGQVSTGSQEQTVYGPTGSQGSTPNSGALNSSGGSGGRPIAPFGGRIMVGTRVGQIEVTGVLGKGGMGEVFKGYHHALDINCAVKVLPDELSRNELVRQRFLREARLCVKLDHSNVVRVYNVDEYAGNLFLVMEMVEGTDAAHMLKNGGRFRYKRALEIGAASAEALAYAHTQGLVHRDVKPHNILLGASDGKIKLSDFGLARAATSSSHLTMSGQIMGTPHYMSPEQAEAKEVTDKSDVYSLGVTLYHMLTGETPFVGDTPISVAVQHIAKEIIYPEVRFKPFPKELVAVLKRMTAKDPAKRCSAKQAAVWLRKLIGMASDEDVKVEDEGAMKSMAPVVRESQAFEAAKKEREQRDNQARELAQTMMATMKEDSGRRPSVAPTMAESAPSATTSQAMQTSGAGSKVVITILVMLLLFGGGGAAGWYYTLGPGAENNKGNQPIVAGDDGNSGGTNTAGADGGTTDGGKTDGGTTDGGNTDGGTTDGGSTDGGSTDGGTTDGGNTDGGSTTPPPEQDDPLVAAALTSAGAAITNANSLADLAEAEKQLARAKMEKSKASAKQRAELEDLDARFTRQKAFLAASEGFDRIREALVTFEQKRGVETAGAIAALNTAIAERDLLAKLIVPPEAEPLVAPDRDALTANVNTALSEYWSDLDAQASRLEKEQQFDEAANILEDMETIKAAAEDLALVGNRRRSLQVRAIHKVIKAALAIPDFKEAIAQLKKAEEVTIPEELKTEHAKVISSVGTAIENKLAGYLQAAREAADRGEFESALNERDAALDLPGRTNEQTSRIADVSVYIELSDLTLAAEEATASGKFNAARETIDAGKQKIEESGERKLPQPLIIRFNQAEVDFENKLQKRFAGLMASAKSSIDSKDFESASADITAAEKLPLSPEQNDELKRFKEQNEKALSEYVSTLITEIGKALDSNDFETASTKLELVKSLKIPPDQQERFDEVDKRYGSEAVNRHSELLDAARQALDKRDYQNARTALDAALIIPVVGTAADRAKALDREYYTLLKGEVAAHLEKSDQLIEEKKFKQAKVELDAAAKLPIGDDDDLDRQVRRKLELWAAAVENELAQTLKDAAEARDAELFTSAQKLIAEAYELPLTPEQTVRVSKANDELKAAIDAFKEKLFKELEGYVEKGREKEGKRVVEKLRAMNPGPGEQLRINKLETSLTGESDSDRYKRLPSHLRTAWQDKFCKAEQLITVGEEISALAVSSDGKFAAAGTTSGRVYFYNLKRGTQLGSSRGGSRRITALAVSNDGKYAASGNDDGMLVLFDLSGSVQASDMGNAGDDVYGLAFSNNNNALFAATREGNVARYNPSTKARIGGATPTGLRRAQCMALSPDGNLLAIGGEEAWVAVFDANRMILKEKLEGPGDDVVHSVQFSEDSSQLIAGSNGDGVAVWDTRRLTKKPTRQYKGLDEWVHGAGFTKDGLRCAAFDSESRLMVWDVKSGIELRNMDYDSKLKGDKKFFPGAGVIGPDGTVLIGTREGELVHLTLKPAG